MTVTAVANKSAFSLSIQFGIPSGPSALFGFSAINFLKMENSETQNASDLPSLLICQFWGNNGVRSLIELL